MLGERLVIQVAEQLGHVPQIGALAPYGQVEEAVANKTARSLDLTLNAAPISIVGEKICMECSRRVLLAVAEGRVWPFTLGQVMKGYVCLCMRVRPCLPQWRAPPCDR